MTEDRNLQSRRNPWPFDGESPVARARRITHMYRARLRALSVAACDDTDQAAIAFGETWVVPRLLTHNDDDFLPPADAADFLCIKVDSLGDLRRRGRLTGHMIDGVFHYLVKDLRAVQEKRPRGGVVDPGPGS